MKAQKKLAKYSLENRVENEVRVMRPKLGHKADYRGGRSAAINIFCLSCMGNDKLAVKACQSYACPLWQFRPGKKRGEKPPGIPTEAQYKELLNASTSQKRRDAGKRLHE
jgi:hypothetical protein